MMQPSFGKLPFGARLERVKKSPNYKNSSFQNIQETKVLAEGASYISMIKKYFKTEPGREPQRDLPAIKTDLHSLQKDKDQIIWFGHSSYLILIEGKRILVDPVFSERPSPFQFTGSKSYPGTRIFNTDDIPELDAIIISHDHYDHLDYLTISKIKSKTGIFCAPIGVGEHLEYWGVDQNKIIEFDWWESKSILPGIQLISTPARHFSGRGFHRNKTLWTSYVLKSSRCNIFIGGDSGYDSSFKTIGEKFGPFDLAILECGQYDLQWPYIHMMPEETVTASLDLNAKVLFPVHWGKFTLALHTWTDPIQRVVKHAELLNVKITTPKIGEPIILGQSFPETRWWEL